MRFRLLTSVLTAAVLGTAASAGGATPPPASIKLTVCSRDQHEAAFLASMRLVEGADRMALRFTLLERPGVADERRRRVPGLGRWHRSKPGVVELRYNQGVRNLDANASYRARVDFRWFSESGTEVLRVRRRSAACRQFVELPNLAARIVRIRSTGMPGIKRYETLVTNTGEAPVAAARVRLAVDRNVIDTVTVPVAAHGSRTVVIRGPDCRGRARVIVDPANLIAESSEDDNAHQLSC